MGIPRVAKDVVRQMSIPACNVTIQAKRHLLAQEVQLTQCLIAALWEQSETKTSAIYAMINTIKTLTTFVRAAIKITV